MRLKPTDEYKYQFYYLLILAAARQKIFQSELNRSSENYSANETNVGLFLLYCNLLLDHYKPYGEVVRTASTGPDIARHKYTGQEEDAESSLMYYGARYYDVALGRFLSADTNFDPGARSQGLNRYMYVGGNPVRFRDNNGRFLIAALVTLFLSSVFVAGGLAYESIFAAFSTSNLIRITSAYVRSAVSGVTEIGVRAAYAGKRFFDQDFSSLIGGAALNTGFLAAAYLDKWPILGEKVPDENRAELLLDQTDLRGNRKYKINDLGTTLK